MPSRGEKDLTAFLATLPDLERKRLEQGFSSFNQDELNRWIPWEASNAEQSTANTREYHRLLSRVPAKLREYLKREKREIERLNQGLFEFILPKVPRGRPKLDELASEGEALKSTGLSWPQVAQRLNQIYGPETTTPQNIRSLIRSRRRT